MKKLQPMFIFMLMLCLHISIIDAVKNAAPIDVTVRINYPHEGITFYEDQKMAYCLDQAAEISVYVPDLEKEPTYAQKILHGIKDLMQSVNDNKLDMRSLEQVISGLPGLKQATRSMTCLPSGQKAVPTIQIRLIGDNDTTTDYQTIDLPYYISQEQPLDIMTNFYMANESYKNAVVKTIKAFIAPNLKKTGKSGVSLTTLTKAFEKKTTPIYPTISAAIYSLC